MNRVILIGNLANDPEYTQLGDTAKCTFRLAVQRKYADSSGNRQADFLQVVCWRKLAENCAKYLAKGRKACVEGSIQTRSYVVRERGSATSQGGQPRSGSRTGVAATQSEIAGQPNAQDGTKRYVTEIIADSVEFLSTAQMAAGDPGPTPPPERRAEPEHQYTMQEVSNGGFTELPDDSELPF